jgi:hypothetical protein
MAPHIVALICGYRSAYPEGKSCMARTVNVAQKLRKIAAALEELAAEIESLPGEKAKPVSRRKRRSKKEAAQLKKMLRAERKAGIPVAELAKKHGISPAYIYMLQ